MRPLDPRLLRYAGSAKWLLLAGAAVGLAITACMIAFAWLVTNCVTGAINGRSLTELLPSIGLLVVVVIARAGLVYAQDAISARGAAQIKSELRMGVLAAVAKLGPSWLDGQSAAKLATLLGRGMDALDDYFAKYVPQLILTAIVTPVMVIVIFFQDWISALFVIVTLPLIPVFMMLIGWATQAVQRRQWNVLGELSADVVDMLGGLATLKIFGRQHRQVERMRRVTRDYRVETMKVLRVSFLSGFALELAASLSVALVAVSIGLRLVEGELSLAVGLFVLLLAPEAFLPLRQVGANFHAAAEGVEAADDAFSILDRARNAEAEAPTPHRHTTDGTAIELRELSVDYGDGPVFEPLSARFAARTVTVIAGPSGVGKSSVLAAVNGFVPYRGDVLLGGTPDGIAWAGQHPGLVYGTVAENVALGDEQPDSALVVDALTLAAAPDLDPGTPVGVAGSGLSGGQAQRVAIARALYRLRSRSCEVLLLDEPSSALDRDTEAQLLANLRTVAADGAAVIVVSHRRALIEAADAVVAVSAAGRVKVS